MKPKQVTCRLFNSPDGVAREVSDRNPTGAEIHPPMNLADPSKAWAVRPRSALVALLAIRYSFTSR
ncbi:hypothetical protein ABIE21_003289 [Conyzicola nivalis]|uniref:Uncharacterized protein n=1 Tax=Conyzicola nivalis TaxID=1477021 RepID=A0ABV2QSC9_9MICO